MIFFFIEFLLRLVDGTEMADQNDIIKLPSSILVKHTTKSDPLEQLIKVVYPEFKDGSSNLASSNNKAILTTKNYFVDKINDALIIKFPGEVTEYLSYDETFNPNYQGQYVDFLNTLTPNGLPMYRLLLKLDAPIILLRNLDPTEGYVMEQD